MAVLNGVLNVVLIYIPLRVVGWRKIGLYMFKGITPDYVLTYFKCWAGKDANEGEAGFATLKGTHAVPGHECRSFWK